MSLLDAGVEGAAAGESGGVVISLSLGVCSDCGAGGVAGTGERVFSGVFLGVCAGVEGFLAGVVFCD